MTGQLDGRVVVVTGAGRGLGRAYARHAAAAGARVVVNDVDPTAAQSTVDMIGAGAVASSHDVRDPDQASALIALCLSTYGSVDGLVNNAGIIHESSPWDEDPAKLRAIVETNVLGVMYCGVAASRVMREQGHGSIVNAASGGAFGFATMAAYGATKGAVASLTYAWALDMEAAGIRVNAISPMATTRMTTSPLARTIVAPDRAPERVAPLITYLLSDLAEGLTGQFLRFDGEKLRIVTYDRFPDHPFVERERWDVADVAAAFTDTLDAKLQPYGVEGALPPRVRR